MSTEAILQDPPITSADNAIRLLRGLAIADIAITVFWLSLTFFHEPSPFEEDIQQALSTAMPSIIDRALASDDTAIMAMLFGVMLLPLLSSLVADVAFIFRKWWAAYAYPASMCLMWILTPIFGVGIASVTDNILSAPSWGISGALILFSTMPALRALWIAPSAAPPNPLER